MAETSSVTRIRRAAADLDRARRNVADCKERRDKAVVAAADEGLTLGTIAGAAGIGRPAVVAILATPHPWLEQQTAD